MKGFRNQESLKWFFMFSNNVDMRSYDNINWNKYLIGYEVQLWEIHLFCNIDFLFKSLRVALVFLQLIVLDIKMNILYINYQTNSDTKMKSVRRNAIPRPAKIPTTFSIPKASNPSPRQSYSKARNFTYC